MELRRCGRCAESKPLDDFAWRRIQKRQRDNYCRPCRAAYKQEHYQKHRQRYIDQARERNLRERATRVEFLMSYLEEHPCVDCGETDLLVLEFDHLHHKSFGIADGLRFRRWHAVLEEIAKCEVVCANCHRRRTARRSGNSRMRWLERSSGQKTFPV